MLWVYIKDSVNRVGIRYILPPGRDDVATTTQYRQGRWIPDQVGDDAKGYGSHMILPGKAGPQAEGYAGSLEIFRCCNTCGIRFDGNRC